MPSWRLIPPLILTPIGGTTTEANEDLKIIWWVNVSAKVKAVGFFSMSLIKQNQSGVNYFAEAITVR